MSPVDFYQAHLDRVSRSFAFCIAKLEGPLRSWVSLTYLVCRILDTVEDANWKQLSQQLKNFDRFNRLLESPGAVENLEKWVEDFPQDIPAGEKSLLQNSDRIFLDLHAFPTRVRKIIQDMVGSMSAGMQYFSERKVDGQLRLDDLQEVNQYCFFVAGVVGETLTQLLAVEEERTSLPSIVDAHHFGLFLQKVNLLKDQLHDEKDGRFFIPSREEVYKSLGKNAFRAFDYLEALPQDKRDYRLFCAWSFFLGLASLPHIQKAFQTQKAHKISRLETMALLQRVESRIDKPEALRELFNDLILKSHLEPPAIIKSQGSEQNSLGWFGRLYKGKLTPQQMLDLGLIA